MVKRLLFAALGSVLWVGSAYGQTCGGGPALADAPLQGSGGIGFSSNSQTVNAAVTRDFETVFVNGGLELTSVSDVDSGIKGVFGGVGREFPVEAGKRVFVCPSVSIFKGWGPKPAPDLTYGLLVLRFSGTVGFEAATNGSTRIVPMMGVALNRARLSLSGEGFGDGEPFTDSFGTLRLGVGLVFNQNKALVPSLVLPLGADDGEAGFSVVFSMKVGS